MRLSIAAAFLLTAVLPAQDKPEIVSLLGKPLAAREDTSGAVAKADAALAEDPKSLDRLLDAARARDGLLLYNQAIRMYTQGIERPPDDVRFYRFRGHRYISTRRFDAAVADLERARKLAPSSFDVAYHLALAYYMRGEHGAAADEYGRCLGQKESGGALPAGWRDCASVASNDDARVAMSDWRYRALRRAGRGEEAARLLDTIHEKMEVKENQSYFSALLFYKGLREESQILDPAAAKGVALPTIGYAVANFHLVEGRTEKACQGFRRAVEDENWSAFGFIAAEVELARASRSACGGR